jgi:uncharacterized SAM-binding protein YcdF (DUF218 family)
VAAATRRRLLGCLFFTLAAVVLVAVTIPLWLPFVGTALESDGPPRKADLVIVLAGDEHGLRILEAAQIAKDGYAPKVLVSGPANNYGMNEADLAVPFAVRRGYPESMFIRVPHEGRSTRAEVDAIVPEVRRLGAKSVVLVTSDYHTRRAARVFRAAAPDIRLYVVGAPDAEFDLRRWWQEREGRKAVFLEWLKTIAGWFSI